MPAFFASAPILIWLSVNAAVRIAPRSAEVPAGRPLTQAAAAVRPRRLLRRVVLGAVFSPLVRRTRVRRLRTEPSRARDERRRRDAVRCRPRRLRGGCRARRRYTGIAAGADRSIDGLCDRRA